MPFKRWMVLWFALCLSIVSPPPLVQAWEGRVVGVSDGDTITVMHAGKSERIRLWGVDAPEKTQPFGQKAKAFTSDRVFGKSVSVDPITADRYGRTVGVVRLEHQCLNEELITAGLAWVYRQYCAGSLCEAWIEREKTARSTVVGLWSQPEPIAPWDYRHGPARRGTGARPRPSSVSAVSGVYHGNLRSQIFHCPGCSSFDCPHCTVVFRTREAALKTGYRPCRICRP